MSAAPTTGPLPQPERGAPALLAAATPLHEAATAQGADLLVVGVRQDPDGPVVTSRALDAQTQDRIGRAAKAVAATGKHDEVLRLPGEPYDLPNLVLTGLGPGEPDLERIRLASGAAVRQADSGSVAMALTERADADALEAEATGALLGAYRFTMGAARAPGPASVTIVRPAGAADVSAALERASVVAAGVRLARRLVDTPAGDLPPAALAGHAESLRADGLEVEVLDEDALGQQGFGGIVAVGQGSANPPRLVRIAHRPEGAGKHLVLIGKGITFDSGGLSLKPPAGMVAMKYDMAGAAAVLAAIRTIARLRVPVQVTGYLAIAENMPSGTAQRPGDVITSYGGKTVEVLNTDAEGRLVLMDALSRCAADSPDAIIDIATLTGAQIVALGSRIAGVMGNDDGWRDEVVAAADAAGELAWAMPIPEDLRASLDSPVADLANIGERNGGMMTAAAFLREFVPAGVPWAHIDIAGPAFVTGSAWGYNGKGATGYGVRTMLAVAERMARRPVTERPGEGTHS